MLHEGSLKLLTAFDLLEINGYDLRREPGDVLFRYACKWASRVVSKRLDSRYVEEPARSRRAVRGREHHVAIARRLVLADARRPASRKRPAHQSALS
jgi:hypothetical protein